MLPIRPADRPQGCCDTGPLKGSGNQTRRRRRAWTSSGIPQRLAIILLHDPPAIGAISPGAVSAYSISATDVLASKEYIYLGGFITEDPCVSTGDHQAATPAECQSHACQPRRRCRPSERCIDTAERRPYRDLRWIVGRFPTVTLPTSPVVEDPGCRERGSPSCEGDRSRTGCPTSTHLAAAPGVRQL